MLVVQLLFLFSPFVPFCT
ncbi:hypothetical protein MTR67_026298 [Solanum verrucosum]|uniref:Uncharacterized protein n=1 Tax=Solanum verrucosum TaxID=315347 RepID=A0AAF0R2H8_SOLVR|nr:hypothetical protein MTR67_026298 [Solanum verrucosum]